MAEVCSFPEENAILDPPPGWTLEQCECLPVHLNHLPGSLPVIISCWKLTKEELAEVNKTGRIWLTVAGGNMPPVLVAGEKPFASPG